MKTINKPYYKCDHCRKVYQIKSACEKHEPGCKKNPANYQPCFDCDHICKKKVEITHFDHDGYDYQTQKEILFCNSKEVFIHPYWISNPYLQEDIEDEIENIQMPNNCDDYKGWKLKF